MKNVSSQSLLNLNEKDDYEEGDDQEDMLLKDLERKCGDEIAEIPDRLQRMTLQKRETTKRGGDELYCERYGLWLQEQKTRAARIGKQLKVRWELDQLIEEQLNRFRFHYNQTMVPTHLEDIAQLLMPKWTPPHELASLAWFGDWRPSAILSLLHGLAISSSLLSDSIAIVQILPQLVHNIRIEEAILDEEMAEIQATCILHLPFSPINNHRCFGVMAALRSIQTEFKKIESVINKAQQLRFKALELVVKKVLNQNDAAEFLVAFTGIQEGIHQFAMQHGLKKGPVNVPLKPLGCTE